MSIDIRRILSIACLCLPCMQASFVSRVPTDRGITQWLTIVAFQEFSRNLCKMFMAEMCGWYQFGKSLRSCRHLHLKILGP